MATTGTITPTTGQEKFLIGNVFVIGDQVASLDTGLSGVILETNFGGNPKQVYIRWVGGPLPAGPAIISRLRRA